MEGKVRGGQTGGGGGGVEGRERRGRGGKRKAHAFCAGVVRTPEGYEKQREGQMKRGKWQEE